jgi:gluconate:H+ symporter, GntP family
VISSLLLLVLGLLLVIGGIVWLRMHAFLALALAAFVVGALTPKENRLKNAFATAGFHAEKGASETGAVVDLLIPKKKKGQLRVGLHMVAKRLSDDFPKVAELQVLSIGEEKWKGQQGKRLVAKAKIITLVEGMSLEKSDVLLSESAELEVMVRAGKNVGSLVADGFGKTCAKVGIIIAMAAIIGTCMMESGAAIRIVRSALSIFGEKRAPEAMAGSSFLLGIPVFFDTLFYLMVPLAKALALQTKKNYLLYVLAIVAGGAMTHSLVPPTPGPLLVAGELGVDLGRMIVGGLLVGSFGMTGAFLYARWYNRKFPMEVRSSGDMGKDAFMKFSELKDDKLPSLLFSLSPILLPVILIAGNSFLKQVTPDLESAWFETLQKVVGILGDKNLALTIGSALALLLLIRSPASRNGKVGVPVGNSLKSAGTIILITGMGGAFGGILQQTALGLDIRTFASSNELGSLALLVLAFFATSAIRIAQGSATVAMITSVGIVGGLVSQGFGVHPVYLALAIGCGAKPMPWMNDSGFWVVGKLSGLTEKETLQTFSVVIALQGIVGMLAVLLFASFFPNFLF